jgi:DUF4097 and DUF4098 domain-containing protein YvlB
MTLSAVNTFRAGGLTLALLALGPAGAALPAAQQNAAADDWCRDENWGRDREGVCEVRQYTLPATGAALDIGTTNGGIQVEGQTRGDVHVLARVVATADTEARAREIAKAVQVSAAIDRVEATGPRGLQNGEGWNVSYRAAVPRHLDLSLHTTNGGIRIRDVESKISFRTTNGGVHLVGIGGEVKGRTTNGGVNVELDGAAWQGDGLDVETSNGGVRLLIPEQYSAQLYAATNNGGLSIDAPGAVQNRRQREVNLQLGAGGAPIRLRTSNGGVRVTRK